VWTICCFSSLKYPERFRGPDGLPFDGYRGSFPWIKRPGPKADHLPPSTGEIKSEWDNCRSGFRLLLSNRPTFVAEINVCVFSFGIDSYNLFSVIVDVVVWVLKDVTRLLQLRCLGRRNILLNSCKFLQRTD
jgi:hypothetical protein